MEFQQLRKQLQIHNREYPKLVKPTSQKVTQVSTKMIKINRNLHKKQWE